MGDTKALKKENKALRQELENLKEQLASLSKKLDEKVPPDLSKQVQPADVQFLSDSYEDLQSFRKTVESELQNLKSNLLLLSKKIDELKSATEAAEEYSYRYNIKILGMPEVADKETASQTTDLCLRLFKAMGADEVCFWDIDTAHRVDRRETSKKGDDEPKPIICKFTRRLAKDQVMSKRKNIKEKVTSDSLRFVPDLVINIRVYDHLTPKVQGLLYEARCFQTRNQYKHCWVKGSVVNLRETDESAIIRIKSKDDLDKCSNRRNPSSPWNWSQEVDMNSTGSTT